jgi:hypothetical protein
MLASMLRLLLRYTVLFIVYKCTAFSFLDDVHFETLCILTDVQLCSNRCLKLLRLT